MLDEKKLFICTHMFKFPFIEFEYCLYKPIMSICVS